MSVVPNHDQEKGLGTMGTNTLLQNYVLAVKELVEARRLVTETEARVAEAKEQLTPEELEIVAALTGVATQPARKVRKHKPGAEVHLKADGAAVTQMLAMIREKFPERVVDSKLVAKLCGCSTGAATHRMSTAMRAGLMERVGRGLYRLPRTNGAT